MINSCNHMIINYVGYIISYYSVIVNTKIMYYADFCKYNQIWSVIYMYNSQQVAKIIKDTAKSKGVTLKVMLTEMNQDINLISRLASGQNVSYVTFARIADYLDCSVDYLLGRQTNISVSNVYNTSSVNSVGSANITTVQEAPENSENDEMTSQLLKWFKDLPYDRKIKVMNFVLTQKDEEID